MFQSQSKGLCVPFNTREQRPYKRAGKPLQKPFGKGICFRKETSYECLLIQTRSISYQSPTSLKVQRIIGEKRMDVFVAWIRLIRMIAIIVFVRLIVYRSFQSHLFICLQRSLYLRFCESLSPRYKNWPDCMFYSTFTTPHFSQPAIQMHLLSDEIFVLSYPIISSTLFTHYPVRYFCNGRCCSSYRC